MNLPLIVFEHGDVMIFNSLAELEAGLEALELSTLEMENTNALTAKAILYPWKLEHEA